MRDRHEDNEKYTREAFDRAVEAYGGNVKAAQHWFHESNRMLGGRSPLQMTAHGQAKMLCDIIKTAFANTMRERRGVK